MHVLNVDRERERIALSRKRPLPDPWQRVIADLHEGEVVEGTVTGGGGVWQRQIALRLQDIGEVQAKLDE